MPINEKEVLYPLNENINIYLLIDSMSTMSINKIKILKIKYNDRAVLNSKKVEKLASMKKKDIDIF